MAQTLPIHTWILAPDQLAGLGKRREIQGTADLGTNRTVLGVFGVQQHPSYQKLRNTKADNNFPSIFPSRRFARAVASPRSAEFAAGLDCSGTDSAALAASAVAAWVNRTYRILAVGRLARRVPLDERPYSRCHIFESLRPSRTSSAGIQR